MCLVGFFNLMRYWIPKVRLHPNTKGSFKKSLTWNLPNKTCFGTNEEGNSCDKIKSDAGFKIHFIQPCNHTSNYLDILTSRK